jgi:thiol:disulfide interchange protein DsbC
MALVAKLGITGTPAIITSEGRLLPGYVPAKKLADMLDKPQTIPQP